MTPLRRLPRTARVHGWRNRLRRGRDGWLRALVGDLLPESVLARRGGAHLQEVMFGGQTSAFAGRCWGRGLDESLVDPERLRSAWLGDGQDFRTALLMQLAWMQQESVSPAGHDLREPAVAT